MVATIVLDGTKIATGDDVGGAETWDATRWRGTGGAPSGDPSDDVFLEGTNAALTRSNNSRVWLWFDIGAGNELDLSTSGLHVSIWGNMLAAGLLQLSTYNSGVDYGGIGVALGTSTTDVREWNFGGKDTYSGGWKNFTVDPTSAGTNDRGTYDDTSIRYFGLWCDTSTAAKFDNFVVDSIVVGEGLRVYGTSTTDDVFGDILLEDEGTVANKYGTVRSDNGVIYVKGRILLGDNVGTNGSTLTSANRTVVYEMQEYRTSAGSWVDAVSSTFNQINRVGNSTNGTDLTIGDGTTIQAGSSVNNTPIVSVDLDDAHTGSGADLTIIGARFSGISGLLSLSLNGAHTMDGTIINDCVQVTGVGDVSDGIIIRSTTFQNSTDTGGALLWGDGTGNDAGMDIQSCSFNNNISAIEFGDQGSSPFTFVNMLFSGNTNDIHLSHATESITISATGTSNPSTKLEDGSGTITIQNNKALTLSDLIANTEVRILDSNKAELDGIENSGTSFVYSYSYVPATTITIMLLHIDYLVQRFPYLLTADDAIIPIQYTTDRVYSNP